MSEYHKRDCKGAIFSAIYGMWGALVLSIAGGICLIRLAGYYLRRR